MQKTMKNFNLLILLLLPLIGFSQKGQTIDSWYQNSQHNGLPAINMQLTMHDPLSEFCTLTNPVILQEADITSNGIFSDLQCSACDIGDMNILPDTQIVAENFTFVSATQVGSICWSGIFFDTATMMTCNPFPTNAFTITYYEDDLMTGLPGAEIMSFTGVEPSTIVPTGNFIIGAEQHVFTAEHTPIDFEAGLFYWVSIHSDLNGGDCDFAWDLAVDGSGDAFSAINFSDPIAWAGGSIDFAVAIGSTAPIPTLSQWGVIILGFLILIFGVVTVKYVNRTSVYEA